ADQLKRNGVLNGAAGLYSKAAKLFLEKGKIPAAIALKIMQWQISSPKKGEVKNFLLNLKQVGGDDTPVNSFFCQLNFQESIALFSLLKIIHLPPDHTVKKVGDIEDAIYFVISGGLKDSMYQTMDDRKKVYREPNLYLYENDYFGDIYPFDRDKKSNSYVETKSQVELLRISKEKLRKICIKYPKIEHGLLNLLKVRSKASMDDLREKLRDARRIPLKLELGIEILLKGSQNTSIHLSGNSSDISIGGICFILDDIGLDSYSEILSFENGMKNAKVQVNFPIEDLKVSIPGKIVWLSPVLHEGRKTISLGIQFEKMSPKLKGLLMMFFNSFDKK
ncbi:MAG: PilZ domain-containing protein, partial [Cyclobacteriaceae bacterium]|nr:PilZ domain-containing protein [Cyclobacteriaceae bacterium]